MHVATLSVFIARDKTTYHSQLGPYMLLILNAALLGDCLDIWPMWHTGICSTEMLANKLVPPNPQTDFLSSHIFLSQIPVPISLHADAWFVCLCLTRESAIASTPQPNPRCGAREPRSSADRFDQRCPFLLGCPPNRSM